MYLLLLILSIIVLMIFVGVVFVRDRRKIRRHTVDSIGKSLWNEIDEERRTEVEKGKRFRKLLGELRGKGGLR